MPLGAAPSGHSAPQRRDVGAGAQRASGLEEPVADTRSMQRKGVTVEAGPTSRGAAGDSEEEAALRAKHLEEALLRCAAEPIQYVNSIQPHGVLLGVDDEGCVRVASDNLESLFGRAAVEVLARPIGELLADEALPELRAALLATHAGRCVPVDLRARCGDAFVELHALAHRSEELTIIELQRASAGRSDTAKKLFGAVRESLWTLDRDTDIETYCRYAADEIRRVIDFDRVMVYRFDSQWNGEVIAQSGNDALPSLLHHHFPASDIPPQARALYARNLVRLLADIDAVSVPLLPAGNAATGRPFDLSLSVFRAMSPIHLEYLRNMGVRSTVTVSLMHEGRLWGLIACHDVAPTVVDAHLRDVVEFIGKSVSIKLGALESAARLHSMESVRQRLQNLTEIIRGSSDFDLVIRTFQEDYLSLAAAGGSYVLVEHASYVIGDIPPRDELAPLIEWLAQQHFDHGVFVTDHLGALYPPAREFASVASGLLAIDLDNKCRSLILWFRPEVVRNIPWAGDPRGKVVTDAFGPRIDPRRSFAVWLETARGFSKPWENSSIDAVRLFSFSVVQMLMHRAQQQVAVADAASKAKSGFLANMSHEIRTPMNAIIGLTYLCQQTSLDDQQRDYLGKIGASANNLLRILNDVLDFSKIEAGRLAIEETAFELARVLDSVATVTAIQAQEKRLELIVDVAPECPRLVVGDPLRLEQVLVNLASNAVKFTRTGDIVMSVRAEAETSDTVTMRFTVVDTGIGMSAEAISRLFQPFQQADNSITRDYGGTGLGLSICRHLVEMMGGTIEVASEPGKGSRFSFTARLGKCASIAAGSAVALPDLRGLHALIVDDNDRAREVTRHYLESFRFRVTDVSSGEAALDACERSLHDGARFDLVVIDWEMPELDGLETARRIAALTGGVGRPRILLVSMHGHAWNLPESAHVGALLTKPFTPSRLFNAVAGMFARQGSPGLVTRGQLLERRKLAGAQLLLVEDNDINQIVAKQILEGAGAIVTIAGDGAVALQRVRERHFDGVLMDIHMPVMDGYTASREIRREFPAHVLPIIAMTANAMSGDREKSLAAGMNDHITKPVNPEEMFATLARWIVAASPSAPPPSSVPTPQPGPRLPQIRGVAVAEAVARLDGDVEDYLKLIERFRRGYRGAVVEIRLALIGGRRQEAERTAHTLNGLAATLGATSLRAKMRELEGAIRRGVGQDGLAGMLDSADADLEALHTAIAQALPDTTAQAALPSVERLAGAARLHGLVRTALAQLADCEAAAEDSVAQLFAQLDGDAALAPLLARVREGMDRYDYEAAHRELVEVARRLDAAQEGTRA